MRPRRRDLHGRLELSWVILFENGTGSRVKSCYTRRLCEIWKKCIRNESAREKLTFSPYTRATWIATALQARILKRTNELWQRIGIELLKEQRIFEVCLWCLSFCFKVSYGQMYDNSKSQVDTRVLMQICRKMFCEIKSCDLWFNQILSHKKINSNTIVSSYACLVPHHYRRPPTQMSWHHDWVRLSRVSKASHEHVWTFQSQRKLTNGSLLSDKC
jgi:hypothetical protein